MNFPGIGLADHRDISRRSFMNTSVCCMGTAMAIGQGRLKAAQTESKEDERIDGKRTDFVHACMTLPYSQYSLQRALEGIKNSGYRHIAWGVTHRDEHMREVPVMAEDAPVEDARSLAQRCRDLGLEPVMMFSTVYPEQERALEILEHRIKQAEAAGIGQILTFGHTQGARRDVWIQRLKLLGPIARDHGVMIVVKQHGGETGTGQACAEIVREVNDPAIKVNYDAGNVMDYLNLDPIADLKSCAAHVISFCIKDHRDWPTDQDCGPGFGEIDHYRLLQPVAFTGRTIVLAYENISAPLLPGAKSADEIDSLARRAREYLETVIKGLQAQS